MYYRITYTYDLYECLPDLFLPYQPDQYCAVICWYDFYVVIWCQCFVFFFWYSLHCVCLLFSCILSCFTGILKFLIKTPFNFFKRNFTFCVIHVSVDSYRYLFYSWSAVLSQKITILSIWIAASWFFGKHRNAFIRSAFVKPVLLWLNLISRCPVTDISS